MKNLLLTLVATLALVAMPTSNAFSQDEVDDIFMDEGAAIDDVPPADGGEVAGPATEEAPVSDEAPPEEKAPKKEKPERAARAADRAEAPKAKPVKARKTASTKGGFRVLKSDCELHEQASSDSPVVLTAKTSKKLWVEEQDGGWVKGFHKNGEGFFSSGCFK